MGTHTDVARARDRMRRGFRMPTITADLVALRAKIADDLDRVRRGDTGAATNRY